MEPLRTKWFRAVFESLVWDLYGDVFLLYFAAVA
jgi:hypothetical protein